MGIQKDLFRDGKVTYDYIEGKSVTLRVAGFKIVIYKPYTKNVEYTFTNEVYEKAVVDISTNATVSMNMSDLILINKSIMEAINILNKEGYHLIDIHNWNDFGNVVNLDKHPEFKIIKPKTIIKTIKISVGDLFIDKNSNIFLYVGIGYLKALLPHGENRNVPGCNHLYIRMYKENIKDIKVCENNDALIVGADCWDVGSYSTLKRATKILANYGEHKNLRLTKDYIDDYKII